MSDYPKRKSDVEVTFNDGTVQTYRITAGASLARHLVMEAGESGILSLLCGSKAHAIPLANIREWSITELEDEDSA